MSYTELVTCLDTLTQRTTQAVNEANRSSAAENYQLEEALSPSYLQNAAIRAQILKEILNNSGCSTSGLITTYQRLPAFLTNRQFGTVNSKIDALIRAIENVSEMIPLVQIGSLAQAEVQSEIFRLLNTDPENNQFTIPFLEILKRNKGMNENIPQIFEDINQGKIYLEPTELGNILAEIRDSGSTFNIDFIGQSTVALYDEDIYRKRHGGEGRKLLTPSTILQEGRFYAENDAYEGEILRVHLLLNNIQALRGMLATKTRGSSSGGSGGRSSSGGSGGRSSSGGSGGRSSGGCLNDEDLYKASFDPQNKIVYRTPSEHCFSMDDLNGIKILFRNALRESGYANKVVLTNPYTQYPLVNTAGELKSLLDVLPEAERPFFTLAAFERKTDEARAHLDRFRMKSGKRNKKRSSRKSSRKRRGSKNEKHLDQKNVKRVKTFTTRSVYY